MARRRTLTYKDVIQMLNIELKYLFNRYKNHEIDIATYEEAIRMRIDDYMGLVTMVGFVSEDKIEQKKGIIINSMLQRLSKKYSKMLTKFF